MNYLCDYNGTRSRNHLGYKRTLSHWPWVFLCELSCCGFKSRCSRLSFRYQACFEQGPPWHSGNYRAKIHSKTCTWHEENIQYELPMMALLAISISQRLFQRIFHKTTWSLFFPETWRKTVFRSKLDEFCSYHIINQLMHNVSADLKK